MKLHIGCGKRFIEGYKHLDILDFDHIDYQCPAWDICEKDDSFEEIYSRHFFEHLNPFEVKQTLTEWRRVLKPGGIIHMVLPNIEYHCKQLYMPGRSPFLPNISNYEHAIRSIYGWVDNTDENLSHMEHKWGYTRVTLTKTLNTYGFKNVRFLPCRECDLDVIAEK
jgi:predicted SAM-dependent methyltransferase